VTESDSIAFASNGICYVRLAATTTAPVSFVAVLASPISIQPVYFVTYAYGATPVSQNVVIKSTINTPVEVKSVELDAASPNSAHFHFAATPVSQADSTVPPNDTNTNWALIPNNNLDAGTYNTWLEMAYVYNGNTYTARADVYLTVEKADWDMSAITGVFDVAQTRAQQLVFNVSDAPHAPAPPSSPVPIRSAPSSTTRLTAA
jgi:hypothetical protein